MTITVTDLDGNFQIETDYGVYNIQISYIGYETVNKEVNLNSAEVNLNVSMITRALKEINIVADIAIDVGYRSAVASSGGVVADRVPCDVDLVEVQHQHVRVGIV